MLVDEQGALTVVGNLQDELSRETIAATLEAIRETSDLMAFGQLNDILIGASQMTLFALAGSRRTLALGLDTTRANLGLVRVQAKKVASVLLE